MKRRRIYKCDYEGCFKVYIKSLYFKVYRRIYIGEKFYKCFWEGCLWRFVRLDEFIRYYRKYIGVKLFKCFYCDRCFLRLDYLLFYMKRY